MSEAIKVFRRSYAELSSAIEYYFETRHEEVTKNEMYHDQDWLRELKKEIYSSEGDGFSPKISGAKDQLASALRAYVK